MPGHAGVGAGEEHRDGRADRDARSLPEPGSLKSSSYLSSLRSNGLAEVTGSQVRAAAVFFLVAQQGHR